MDKINMESISPSNDRMSITWRETLMFLNVTAAQASYLIITSKQIADEDGVIL